MKLLRELSALHEAHEIPFHFGLKDSGNVKKAKDALSKSNPKVETDKNGGITYFYFPSKSALDAGVKVVKKVIDVSKEDEWGSIKESKTDLEDSFTATDIAHNPGEVTVLVMPTFAPDSHGVNVIFKRGGGRVLATTADQVADDAWDNSRQEIISVAKRELGPDELKHLQIKSVDELHEAAGNGTHIFIAKSDFDRNAMNDLAMKLGIWFTAKGTGDKDVPGFDVKLIGDENSVAEFLMKHGLKKGASKKAAIQFIRHWSNVMEAAETIELTKFDGKEIPHGAWPRGVKYKGQELFQAVYEEPPIEIVKAEGEIKETAPEKLEFQEVFLGYSPSKDVFIHGYDGWLGDDNCSPYIVFTLDEHGRAKVVQKGYDITRNGFMWYDGAEGGHNVAKRRFPDLINIRLD